MSGAAGQDAAPVSPRVIEVPDLRAACSELGLPTPPEGATTMEVELLPGRVATITEAEGPPTAFVYVCTSSLTDARSQFEAAFGKAQWGPDSVDPETSRVRGCLGRAGGLVIDAVHCPRAEDAGVPCSEDCSPSLSFE